MVSLVKFLGIFILVTSVSFMLKPDMIKRWMELWTKGKRIYIGAAINLIIGVLLLRGASQCTLPAIVTVVGILSLIKGVALLVRGPESLKFWSKLLKDKSASVLRLFLLLGLAIGVLLIYAA